MAHTSFVHHQQRTERIAATGREAYLKTASLLARSIFGFYMYSVGGKVQLQMQLFI
jgi:hypothetical protein